MALTAGTKGFYFRKNQTGDAATPPIGQFILGNSKTIALGDAITLSSGLADVCTAADRPIGICVGIVDKNGLPVFGPDSHASIGAATVTGDDTFASASNNATVSQCKVQVLIARPGDLYYNDTDSSLTIANVGGMYDMESTGDQVDVSGGGGTPAVWQIVEIDPDNDSDASKALVRIVETYWQSQ